MPSASNSSLIDQIFSSDDLRAVIEEIEAYRKWYSHHSIRSRFTKRGSGREPELSAEGKQVLSDWLKSEPLTVMSLNRLISNLGLELKKAQRVSVTLAAIPSGELKKQITDWCRKNISPSILIDFRANATILGGMVIIFSSHVYDLSIRRQLLDSRDKLIEVLNRV